MQSKTQSDKIEYRCIVIEDLAFAENRFNNILRLLAFHDNDDFIRLCRNIDI